MRCDGSDQRDIVDPAKLLLQRSALKFAIPGVGVPLSIGVNYWSAKVAGRQAAAVFRREARIMATARRITGPDVDHAGGPTTRGRNTWRTGSRLC